MIGVVARAEELEWVEEFFELFKTPWELATPGKRYSAVLASVGDGDGYDAPLVMVYGSDEREVDRRNRAPVQCSAGAASIRWNDDRFPLYGRVATFGADGRDTVLHAGSGAVDYRQHDGTTLVRRIGYDLFREVRHLLTSGQTPSHAETATLEMHIDVVRTLLRDSGVTWVEIPPRPHGTAFICCLTHDIDFFGVRRHRADATLGGFVVRGTVGALVDVVRGRRPVDELWRNWLAVLSLPLVFLGLRRDFWQPFDDYRQADGNRPSTFFLIPFKQRAGIGPDGATRQRRAAPYGVRDISDQIHTASGPSTEFALHGIDAWRDAADGRAELRELTRASGQTHSGVRMHWLYYSDASPRAIEDAGFTYDSTWGYNDAVGFRAGTSQAFRLPGTRQLLELPLAIMDTALFYPSRMGLTRTAAMARCRGLLRQMHRFGGALVINWHDRSLVPERQWGRPYRELLADMPTNTWFATAGHTVEWFAWRRSVRFCADDRAGTIRVEARAQANHLPAGSIVVRRQSGETSVEELQFSGESRTIVL